MGNITCTGIIISIWNIIEREQGNATLDSCLFLLFNNDGNVDVNDDLGKK